LTAGIVAKESVPRLRLYTPPQHTIATKRIKMPTTDAMIHVYAPICIKEKSSKTLAYNIKARNWFVDLGTPTVQ